MSFKINSPSTTGHVLGSQRDLGLNPGPTAFSNKLSHFFVPQFPPDGFWGRCNVIKYVQHLPQ